MFQLSSEAALLQAFRPKDRRTVEPPAGVTYPLFVRTALTWTHPAGGRVFLVFAVRGGAPTGIAFDTQGGGQAPVAMCEWCHHSAAGTGVGLLTTQVTSSRRVGVHVCVDLSCARHLEEAADLGGRSPVPGWQALVERMGRFAREGLGMDLSGAGR
jgi:hypothetical protein